MRYLNITEGQTTHAKLANTTLHLVTILDEEH